MCVLGCDGDNLFLKGGKVSVFNNNKKKKKDSKPHVTNLDGVNIVKGWRLASGTAQREVEHII